MVVRLELSWGIRVWENKGKRETAAPEMNEEKKENISFMPRVRLI